MKFSDLTPEQKTNHLEYLRGQHEMMRPAPEPTSLQLASAANQMQNSTHMQQDFEKYRNSYVVMDYKDDNDPSAYNNFGSVRNPTSALEIMLTAVFLMAICFVI